MSVQLNIDHSCNHALYIQSNLIINNKIKAFNETVQGKISIDGDGRVYGSKVTVDKTINIFQRFILAIVHAITSFFESRETKQTRLKNYQVNLLGDLVAVIENHLLVQPPRERGNLFQNDDLNIYNLLIKFRPSIPRGPEFLPAQNKMDEILPRLNMNHQLLVVGH